MVSCRFSLKPVQWNELSCGMMLNKIQKISKKSVNASPKMLAPGLDYLLLLRFEVYMYTHGAQMVGLGVGSSRIYRNLWLGLEKSSQNDLEHLRWYLLALLVVSRSFLFYRLIHWALTTSADWSQGLTPGDQPIPVEFHLIRGLLQAGLNHVKPVEVNLRPVFDDPALKFEVGISWYFHLFLVCSNGIQVRQPMIKLLCFIVVRGHVEYCRIHVSPWLLGNILLGAEFRSRASCGSGTALVILLPAADNDDN